MSNILRNESLFGLPFIRRFHKAEFCREIKNTLKGTKYCLKCRQFSFLKASKSDSNYIGRCYLGLREIVKPIHINGKLSGIIYLGNLIHVDEYEDTLNRINKYNHKLGMKKDILSVLDTVSIVNSDEINQCIGWVEILYKSLMFAYNSSSATNTLPSNTIHKKNSFLIQRIKDYVEEYYSSNITAEQFSSLYFVNTNYLRNLFKKQMGLNFTDYLNKFRIEKACQLLKDPQKKIINVSMEVGFNNVTYFNRIFKRYKGISPKEYK